MALLLSAFMLDWARGGPGWGTRGSACERRSWGIYSPESLIADRVLPEGRALPSARVLAQLPSQAKMGRVPPFLDPELSAFLHPAPLCTWRPFYTRLSYLCSPSPASSPDTVPLPTVSPRNTHLLVSWTRQAISPPLLHMLCLPPSSLSLLTGKPWLVWQVSAQIVVTSIRKALPFLVLALLGHQPSWPHGGGTKPCQAL